MNEQLAMNNKQRFLDYCGHMMRLAIPLFDREREKYNFSKFEVGQGIDFLGPPHPIGDAWPTEPYVIYAKTQNTKSEEDEIIQITICPRDDWKPILSVASASFDPVTVETTYSAEKDFAIVSEKIKECFEHLKEG